jgi:hypothetical protein
MLLDDLTCIRLCLSWPAEESASLVTAPQPPSLTPGDYRKVSGDLSGARPVGRPCPTSKRVAGNAMLHYVKHWPPDASNTHVPTCQALAFSTCRV